MVSSLFAAPYAGKADIIWAANPSIISIFPAMVYGVLKRKPVALNVDDLWPEDLHRFGLVRENSLPSKIVGVMARLAYARAQLITAISPGYVDVLCSKYGVTPERVQVVEAGVDVAKFAAASRSVEHDRKTFRVLYSGAFSVAYDFDQILLAAKALENTCGIEFVLQGGGELLRYVQSRSRELALNNFKVIDEIVSREKVAKLLGEADALILPLRDFGTPYLGISSKLYEYQAVGKPIICCAEGQPATYVKDTKSGTIVPPGDSEAVTKSILFLEENRDVAESLGNSGRQHVESALAIEKIGLKMRKTFESLI
jgi:glycosyltransferase involved in cell wall biosynthesis